MNDKKDFEAALKGKNVPLLVLDQKWHRLFAIHGKTDEISATEKELDELLKLQGKYNNELKDLKKLKSKTMTNIVANMGDDGDEKRDKDKQLIDEINEKADNIEGELIEIQKNIKAVNDRLMLLSMDYFSEKIEKNKLESKEIDDWIANIRVELKKFWIFLILNMTILWSLMPIMQRLIMQTMRIRGIDIGIYCYR